MPDIGPLKLLLQGVGSARDIAQLIGLIESVDVKIDKLMKVELKSAISHLQDAKDSESEEERKNLLRDARRSFERASHLEKGMSQAYALLGLACCHVWLGDKNNCRRALERILLIKPVRLSTVFFMATDRASSEKSEFYILYVFILAVIYIFMWTYKVPDFGTPFYVALPLVFMPFFVAAVATGAIYSIAMFITKTPPKSTDLDEEGRRIAAIQLAVSSYLEKPVPWMQGSVTR